MLGDSWPVNEWGQVTSLVAKDVAVADTRYFPNNLDSRRRNVVSYIVAGKNAATG